METVLYLFAGMFAFNSLPHLISGVIGNRHMTPFAKDSSAVVNVVWGFTNIALAAFFVSQTPTGLQPPPEGGIVTLLVGGFLMSLMAARLFSNPNARMPWWPK